MFAKLKYVSTHASSQNCGARDPQPITNSARNNWIEIIFLWKHLKLSSPKENSTFFAWHDRSRRDKDSSFPFRIVSIRSTLVTSIMKFKPSFLSGIAIAIVLALVSSAQAQPVSLRILGAFGAEHPASRAVEIFKTEVERRSQGSLSVDDREIVHQARSVLRVRKLKIRF